MLTANWPQSMTNRAARAVSLVCGEDMSFESRDFLGSMPNGMPSPRERFADEGPCVDHSLRSRPARLAAARAATMAMNEELSLLGVCVDFVTGRVTVSRG